MSGSYEFYLCLRCVRSHTTDSKAGAAHTKYAHPVRDAWLWVSPPSDETLRREWYEEHREALEARIAEMAVAR